MKIKYITCKSCGESTSGRGFWKHKYKVHSDLTDEEFLLKQLNLSEIPKCMNPECNNLCKINYNANRFTTYCSRGCQGRFYLKELNKTEEYKSKMSQVRSNNMRNLNIKNWSDPNYINKMNKLFASKEFLDLAKQKFIKMNSMHWNDPEFIAKMKIVSRNNIAKLRTVRSSKIELIIFNRIKKIFKSAIHSYKIAGYVLDIYIPELNLGVEIDGKIWHDINHDLIRDKLISELLKCNIRRFDSSYVYNISNKDLIYSLMTESSQSIPYVDRLPMELIDEWKSNVNIVTNYKLLTYK